MRRAISKYLIRTAFASCIVIASLMLPVTIATAQSNWFWLQPLPQGNRLTSIEFADAFNGCAVGDVGAIVRTTDGGITWTKIEPPRKVNFYGVDFAKGNPLVLVAVSDSGRIYRSSDGGYNWYLAQTVTSTVIFQDVDFAGPVTAFAVGLAGRIYKSTDAGVTWNQQFSPTGLSLRSVNFWNENCGIIGGDRRVMLTSNGGTNWFVQNLVLNQFDQIVGVSQIDSLTASGVTNNSLSSGGKFFKTTSGGAQWDTVRLIIPTVNNGIDIIRHMSFGNRSKGIICCDLGSILRTTNGGNTWLRDTTFIEYFQRNYGGGLFFSTAYSDSNNAYVTGGGGIILKSGNSGQNWNFAVGGVRDLHGTYFINSQTGWAVGEEGTIQKTTNGGVNWSFYPPLTRQVLREVYFPSAQTGYICGDTGVVLKTTNSGDNWFMLNSGISATLYDVVFLNNETGYIAGGYETGDSGRTTWLRKTMDGGMNWTTLYYNPLGGKIYELHFFDQYTGVALFDIRVERTTDGGNTWQVITGGLNGSGVDMHFPDSQTGYITGLINRVYKTTDQGQSWVTLNTNYFGTTNSVFFLNPNTGYLAGMDGALLYTTSGGANWINVNSVSSTFLREIFFPDSLTGYIVGNFGNILKTTTGGISSVFHTINSTTIDDFELLQNYPNPFNPLTNIAFKLGYRAKVELSVFDIRGRKIKELLNEEKERGAYSIVFDGTDQSSGVYFCSMKISNQLITTLKMLLLS